MRSINDIARAINADLDGLIRPTSSALRHVLYAMPYEIEEPARDLLVEAEESLRLVLEKLTGSRHLPEEKAMVLEARRALLEAESAAKDVQRASEGLYDPPPTSSGDPLFP